MKISENQLRNIIREKIKKVGSKYVLYPKKGGKRLGTHSSKAAAKRQEKAIKASKYSNESIDEAYIKRYVKDPLGGAIRQELVDAPPRFDRKFLQMVYEKFYNERQVDAVNSMRIREAMPPLSYKDRKEFLDYISKLDSDTLYNLQSNAYRIARNQTERYVNDQMQANPLTRSDYPGEGKSLVDATRRSQLFYTDNDFKFIYPNPENIPFQDLQRVAMLQSNELEGVAPGAIQHTPGKQGIEIDEYVDMLASQNIEKTDPKQGESVVKTNIGSLKRPRNFVPDPKFISTPIDDDYDDRDTF